MISTSFLNFSQMAAHAVFNRKIGNLADREVRSVRTIVAAILKEKPVEGEKVVKVDLHFGKVQIVEAVALRYKRALCQELQLQPKRGLVDKEINYIQLAGIIRSEQIDAFRLMAVGEAMGLWIVVTPKRVFGEALSDIQANGLAGLGMVTINDRKSAIAEAILTREAASSV